MTHLATTCPSPVTKWLREHGRDEERDMVCPYCEAIGVRNPRKYTFLVQLVRHIHASDGATSGEKHDELKAADGWYREEFVKSFLPIINDHSKDWLLRDCPRYRF